MVAFGQPSGYKFAQIDINQGLSNSRVKCFLKDKKGFVWIGTVSGLNRYDGYTLKVFRSDQRDTSSLIDSDIKGLFEDPNGKIWVDTWTGQNVFDPETETFTRNTAHVLKGFNIPSGKIVDIKKGVGDYYWFSHATAGLFKYSLQNKTTVKIAHNKADTTSLRASELSSVQEDADGNLWIIHRDGVIEKMDGKTHAISYRNHSLFKKYAGQLLEYTLMVDADNDVWIYINNNNKGVYWLSHGSLLHIDESSRPISINADIVRGIAQDNKGLVWVATDHGGINLINKKTFKVSYIRHNPEDKKSLAQNSINNLYKDREGFIWAGTFKKGVSYYHENMIRFSLVDHQESNGASLPSNDVNSLAEDDKGNLWIGTNGEGLIYYNRRNETFSQFKNDPKKPNTISNNVIVSLLVDRSQMLWIGSYFGGLNSYDGKTFARYRHNPKVTTSLGDDNVWEIFEDSQKRLWIGTLESGVDLFDRERNAFIHYTRDGDNSVHAAYIPAISEDNDGNVWFGTGYGIDVLNNKSGRFTHYLNTVNYDKSLSDNSVISLLNDSKGKMWVGTKEGLNLYDKKSNSFRVFTEKDGLPHNSIISILEDNSNNLWIATLNGLSNLILERDARGEIHSFQFRNYNESDGLQGKQFNEGAFCKTKKGELVFAGTNGINIFIPENITVNELKPEIVFSDLQIFNRSIGIGEDHNGRIILPKSIAHTKEVTLKHTDNVFSIEFTALNFLHPEKNQYKYMLKGFNKEWLTADNLTRKVTYTNLNPGNYTLIVKASNNDGVWNEQGISLNITILPPFWKTKAAFFIYIAFMLGALLFSRHLILQRERLKYRMDKERQEATQLHELDVMKIKFFTNVSHEFRTPLSLIITPLEKIIKQTTDTEQKKQFQMIHRNARRLLNLVNQLLDLRRMEVQEVKINPAEGDIISFIKDTAGSFSDLSEKNSIDFVIRSGVGAVDTIFDKDKLEKIIFNLLSNAFKFTPEHGKVAVDLNLVEKENAKWIEIKVTDTGIGIPAEKHEKIFERFFQHDLPKSMVNQGSGIGLSITSEFVKAHNGIITVESEPNKGSCFTVLIPVKEFSAKEEKGETKAFPQTTSAENEVLNASTLVAEDDVAEVKTTLPTLLLIEDNEDFRFYLKDNLKDYYNILEARNGKEGFERAQHHLPDLIVSDVMMPEMDGIEFCRKIKNEKTLSHIPVILLTARTAEEQRLEGFEVGADDYITKPFNFEILQSRIKNLINQRALFHKDFRKQIAIKASDIKITSLDEKLIQNAIKLVEDNISDADFSVENLSHELGMSRVHLYKKLLSLTGKAPLEFIRTIRIQRAAQLLEKSQLTVAEVAYKVGFNNPKYFTKYFKEEFNVLPSAYAAHKKASE